jgi:hypothetical protein
MIHNAKKLMKVFSFHHLHPISVTFPNKNLADKPSQVAQQPEQN